MTLQQNTAISPRQEEAYRRNDELELAMLREAEINPNIELREFKVDHLFTPGLYTRTIHMPAGSILTSKIHKTEHPFVVTEGVALVRLQDGSIERIEAPHMGVTKPYTQRQLIIEEDCIWTTFHPTSKETVEEVEAEIIERRALPDGTTTNERYLEAMKEELPGQLDYGGAP